MGEEGGVILGWGCARRERGGKEDLVISTSAYNDRGIPFWSRKYYNSLIRRQFVHRS